MAVTHALFTGPRDRAVEAVNNLNDRGFRAKIDRATLFHTLDPGRQFETVTITDPETYEEHEEEIEYAPQTLTNPGGSPLWEDDPSESTIEVLTTGLAEAQRIAALFGFTLRMHGPSGFDSIDEADAVAAGLYKPPSPEMDQLIASLKDPSYRNLVRSIILGEEN